MSEKAIAAFVRTGTRWSVCRSLAGLGMFAHYARNSLVWLLKSRSWCDCRITNRHSRIRSAIAQRV